MPKRYSSILVSRVSSVRPSDLEVGLRPHCQKMRVSSQQLSGAHMVFPQERGLAIRVYYPAGMERSKAKGFDVSDSDEAILEFARHFQCSILFFVLPDLALLNDTNSFVHRVMRLTDSEHRLKIMVVSDTSHAISSIEATANALAPQRCQMREKFSFRTQLSHFCVHSGVDASSKENPAQAVSPQTQEAMDNAAAAQLATAIRDFGYRSGFPLGEADLLLRFLGDLRSIVAANQASTEHIPVEDSTKRELLRFFSGKEDASDGNAINPSQLEDIVSAQSVEGMRKPQLQATHQHMERHQLPRHQHQSQISQTQSYRPSVPDSISSQAHYLSQQQRMEDPRSYEDMTKQYWHQHQQHHPHQQQQLQYQHQQQTNTQPDHHFGYLTQHQPHPQQHAPNAYWQPPAQPNYGAPQGYHTKPDDYYSMAQQQQYAQPRLPSRPQNPFSSGRPTRPFM